MRCAEILKDYEAKLTAGYSQTYTRGQNAGVTVTAEDGQHATVTSGRLTLCSNPLFLLIEGARTPSVYPRLPINHASWHG